MIPTEPTLPIIDQVKKVKYIKSFKGYEMEITWKGDKVTPPYNSVVFIP